MILRVTSAEIVGPVNLRVTFNNGVKKTVDISPLLEGPVFKPLHDPKFFALGRLDPVCGTVVWPNGADLAPEALYEATESVQPLAAGGHNVTPDGGAG